MTRMSMLEAQQCLPEIVKDMKVGYECVITEKDQEIAVLLSMADYRTLKSGNAIEMLHLLKKYAPIGTAEEVIQMRDEGRR